jgi:hypothetical protein
MALLAGKTLQQPVGTIFGSILKLEFTHDGLNASQKV